MGVTRLWLFLPMLVLGYNIDVEHPIIYKDPVMSEVEGNFSSDSFFGYSVLLYSGANKSSSRLFIGAPRGFYSPSSNKTGPGVVHRCPLLQNCKPIKPSVLEDEKGYINITRRRSLKTIIKKQGGWFGASMSVKDSNGRLTVCAPRTLVNIREINETNNVITFDETTMHGMCYSDPVASDILTLENRNLRGYNFNEFWVDPMQGFSIHYVPNEWELDRIVGAPNHLGNGSVTYKYENKSSIIIPQNTIDRNKHFGWSVTSGYFFGKKEFRFAIGAPRWISRGQVTVFNPRDQKNVTVSPKDIGQFFGGSLTAGDLNGDGLDELVVGAPHWGFDEGQVYIYFGSTSGSFGSPLTLKNDVKESQFGYSLASGDIDSDGFADLVVGAPWEESGVIYIYNGRLDLQDISSIKPSQRIAATDILPDIQRFGFSLSKPVDMDRNGYPEVVVGAYKSRHAVVLRGKHIITTAVKVRTYPDSLLSKSRSFVIEVCLTYSGEHVPSDKVVDFQIQARIDEDHNRAKPVLVFANLTAVPDKSSCINETVEFMEEIENSVDPIDISVSHEIVDTGSTHRIIIDGKSNNPGQNDSFWKHSPIEKGRKLRRNVELSVPFNIDCGDDEVCHSNISIDARIYGDKGNGVWAIGSGPATLNVTLKNYGEPAYITKLNFSIPEGVRLHRVPSSYKCDARYDTFTVTCHIANVLYENNQKTLSLSLDMKRLTEKSEHGSELMFNVSVITRSEDHGPGRISLPLQLVAEASLYVSGIARDESYFTDGEITKNFQHIYRVLNLGPTAIKAATLLIKVPVAIGSTNVSFISVYKAQLSMSGELSECSSDITSHELHSGENSSYVPFGEFISTTPKVTSKLRATSAQMKNANEQEHKNKGLQTDNETNDVTKGITNSMLRTIYLNCSTKDVVCATITCSLSSFTKRQDEGIVTLEMRLNVTKLAESFGENGNLIRLNTMAHAKITQPPINPEEPTLAMANVTTVFYGKPTEKSVTLWIIIVLVVLGLILLLGLIGILYWCGFFKRDQKEEMDSLKEHEKPLDDGNDGNDIPLNESYRTTCQI